MDFEIRRNTKEFERSLSDLAKRQLPFALSVAINDTLREVLRNTIKRMRRNLDRPTPFTLRAFALRRANKRTLRGVVFAKDVQAGYLKYAEDGGTRTPRGRVLLQPKAARKAIAGPFQRIARGAPSLRVYWVFFVYPAACHLGCGCCSSKKPCSEMRAQPQDMGVVLLGPVWSRFGFKLGHRAMMGP